MSGTRPVTLIAAVARDRALGRAGKMAWHLPMELRHFREATMGLPVIMGARTWTSLPKGLPGRTCHVVASRPGTFAVPPAGLHADLDEAIAAASATIGEDRPERGIVIAGGAAIYREALVRLLPDTLVITRVDLDVEADVRMPDVDREAYRLASTGPWTRESAARWRVETWVRRDAAASSP